MGRVENKPRYRLDATEKDATTAIVFQKRIETGRVKIDNKPVGTGDSVIIFDANLILELIKQVESIADNAFREGRKYECSEEASKRKPEGK